jgi:hypothetical protein
MLTPLPPPPGNATKVLPPDADAASYLQQAWDAAAADIVATAIKLARHGDIQALRLILDRIAPTPRGRLLTINKLPELKSVSDVPAIHARLVTLVSSGEMTPAEADALSSTLANYVTAVAATDHEARLAAIETRLADAQ